MIEPPDKKWGTELNGTWNGMIGMLARKVIALVTFIVISTTHLTYAVISRLHEVKVSVSWSGIRF